MYYVLYAGRDENDVGSVSVETVIGSRSTISISVISLLIILDQIISQSFFNYFC